ncbi:MAG: aminotransferase class I/II-fold pyridoxal phosphate-dependent enzyme [Bacteroidetes bacterium]|nr:MAG: aminotransferase class I/II-fold pyridoxal phosphate-dependent enzyme [Bacteroidota bacterium]
MLITPANRLSHIQEYYFSKKLREIRRRNAEGEGIINLGIGNPDMQPSDATIKTLIDAAIEPGNHGYQPYKGLPSLRNAMTDWYLNTYGVELNPEDEILPLMGSKEGIMHISMAFLNPGEQVLIPNPGYPTYTSITRLVGATPLYYELVEERQWQPDFEALEKQDLSRVKLMWVNYPHMPTGAPGSAELFEQIIAFGQKHRILICHDNPYSLVLNPVPMSMLAFPAAREVVLELNSLSKSHNMAGWRIGMLAGQKAYLQQVLKVKSNMDSGMFLPLQEAATEALRTPYSWHEHRNHEYRQRRKIAWQILDSLQCTYDPAQTGMFIWARIPEKAESGEAFSEKILNERRVFITPGFIFGSGGHRYIRISLCSPPHLLQEALHRMSSPEITHIS